MPSEADDLGNVTPLMRPRRQADKSGIPLAVLTPADRPAPAPTESGRARRLCVASASLLLHGALLALFWYEPRPPASVGVESISIEITLGATSAAGVAHVQGEQEVQVTSPAPEPRRDDAALATAHAATVMPQDVPVAPRETAPQSRETMATQAEPAVAEPQAAKTESPASIETVAPVPEQQQHRTEQEVGAVQPAPERGRIAAPTKANAQHQQAQTAAAPASDATGGIGRGRSDINSNYNGLVAAHLQRHKQYPAAARAAGATGVATVSFTIDGDGRVAAVQLVRGSGIAALDREVVAMVRRASPFPRPPDGRGRNFTVPVRFNLR